MQMYPPPINLPPPSPPALSDLPHKTRLCWLSCVPGVYVHAPPRECMSACTNPAHFNYTLLKSTSLYPLLLIFLTYHKELSLSGLVYILDLLMCILV